ncbi:hypothetical protein ACQ4PT_000250 [Festuca glaucescens]
MDLEANVVRAIVEANGDGKKLPWALMLCGVLEAGVALWLLVYKVPSSIFFNHGKVVFCSYYGILVAVLLFGLVEAWVGYGASWDLERWRAAGEKLLWFSILAVVVLIGLGGSLAFAAPKSGTR